MPDLNRSLLSEGENADTLGGLTDVSIASPEKYQVLVHDGSQWGNEYPTTVSLVHNAEANTLAVGEVVYLFGGTGNHASVKRADNDSDATSAKTVGIVAESIPTAEAGAVVTRGYVRGIDLSVGYTNGDTLYLGEDGGFTNVKPSAPEHLVYIGVVVSATSNGIIYVAAQNGYELEELHNVAIANVASGDFLKYNGSLWINDAINLGTDTVGDYVGSVAAGTGVDVSNTATEGGTFTVNLANTAVTAATYGSANAVGTFTVDAQGRLTNAANTTISIASSAVTDFAEAAQDAAGSLISNGSQSGISVTYDDANGKIDFDVNDFTITLGGDLTGNVTISNLGNATLNASVAANSVELGTDTTGNYVGSVSAGTGVAVSNTGAEGGAFTVGLANTAVTAATYGAANTVGTFTVDAQGRLTNAANTTIAITSSQVTDFSTSAVTSLTGTADQVSVSAANGAVTISLPSNVTIPNNLVVTGDLTVSGNTTTLNTANLNVEDNFVVLNSGATGSPSLNGGIEIERGDSTNVLLRWNESNDKWEITFDGSTYHQIATNTDVAGVTITSLDNISDVTISNTVASGDFLKWNGTAWVNDPIDLGTDTTGNYMSNVSGGSLITVTHTPSEGSTATVALSNGSSGQIILANSAGVPTYTTVSGDITIDSAGVVSIAANSVALGADTTGNYVADVTAGTGISVSHTPGEGSSANISLSANIADLSDVASTAPSANQVLGWNGNTWTPLTVSGGPEQTNTSITTNSATTIASFPLVDAHAAEFTVKIEQVDRFLSSKVLVLHNGTQADFTKYGEISFPGFALQWVTRVTGNSSFDNTFGVAHANGLWTIAQEDRIRTSTDAITWTTRYSNPSMAYFYSVAYGNGLWAVGGTSDYSPFVLVSTDTITWVSRSIPFNNGVDVYSLAYGNGTWVAGGYGEIATSTDTVTWVSRVSNFNFVKINSIAYGNGTWVAVSDGDSSSSQVRTSTDAITWVTREINAPNNHSFTTVAYGNGIWIAISPYKHLRSSTDAVTWMTAGVSDEELFPFYNDLIYAGDSWIATTAFGVDVVSTDGVTWVSIPGGVSGTDGIGYNATDDVILIADSQGIYTQNGLEYNVVNASLSTSISGGNVLLQASIPNAATTPATAKVLKTLVEE